jgi:hypothetical protein
MSHFEVVRVLCDWVHLLFGPDIAALGGFNLLGLGQHDRRVVDRSL